MAWKDNLAVVLVESRNPLNIGAAARAMLNFGFERLTLVDPYEVAFREARSAAGAGSVLRRARVAASLADAIEDATLVAGAATLRGRVRRQPRCWLPEAAERLREHLKRQRAALVFGSEKFGLSNEHLSRCSFVLQIPTDLRCESMNLGQAVALCCWELARATPAERPAPGPRRPPAAQLERIAARLTTLLDESGYIPQRTRASHLLKIRRLVERFSLSPQDAQVVEGMLRQIAWRMARY